MPRVSVVIPNFNHAPYLRRRVRSVLGQTYRDFEVLLLDDCSTDASRGVIDEFADDPRVRVVLNAVNSGSTFVQWNRGVGLSSGEIVWLAESDDDADPRLLETLVGRLDAHPRVGVAHARSWEIDPAGNRTGLAGGWLFPDAADRWAADFVADGPAEVARYLVRSNTLPNASAAVFRRRVYERVGGADESMRLAGDWKLWASMLAVSDLAHVAEPLNYFRRHPSNVRTLSGTARTIEEDYRVVAHIAATVAVEPWAKELICAALARWWTHGPHLRQWPASSHAAIYRQARRADPAIRRRLARLLAGRAAGGIAARLRPARGRVRGAA